MMRIVATFLCFSEASLRTTKALQPAQMSFDECQAHCSHQKGEMQLLVSKSRMHTVNSTTEDHKPASSDEGCHMDCSWNCTGTGLPECNLLCGEIPDCVVLTGKATTNSGDFEFRRGPSGSYTIEPVGGPKEPEAIKKSSSQAVSALVAIAAGVLAFSK
eukprot:CAMPEP_0204272618 /NCGR_PEP_ID=MMETSP0468-20130131/22190_1 /ASSEMBLY_ACC=CAM_ASM_000383 /TAXON_ID=2969 /ORGANISM="Oxyrrhis marina" /LENGTH=158 /DNA_ID=CAMNT_0051248485 /DNA_START=93 /DNA_END=569 /DNA_ORIENTATION=-